VVPWALFLLLVCYLLGAVPFGLLVARQAGVDLTSRGSGNSGATNAHRVMGLKAGLTVLGLDALKGALAVMLAYFALLPGLVFHMTQVLFGLAAVLGHNYSIFRRFKGGKGIATTFGVMLVLSPQVTFLAALLWVGLLLMTRFSSVASLGSTSCMPLLLVYFSAPWEYVLFGFAAAGLAFWRHRENLERLTEGRELKFDQE
jgi:glycerol-3-phosphate acyltransferase PlsY